MGQGCGGGHVLAFCSDDPSLNPAQLNCYVKLYLKKTKVSNKFWPIF